MSQKMKSYTINLLTTNKPGVLVRVSLVFARRGYNIDSLLVSKDLDGRFARMTITAQGHPDNLDQIIKQVSKLVDIISATVYSEDKCLHREIALFKVKILLSDRRLLLELINHFNAETIDFTEDCVVIQIVEESKKIDAFYKMLQDYEIMEIVRSGKVLIFHSEKA